MLPEEYACSCSRRSAACLLSLKQSLTVDSHRHTSSHSVGLIAWLGLGIGLELGLGPGRARVKVGARVRVRVRVRVVVVVVVRW